MRQRTDPVTDVHGEEHHPAFGLASVHRIHSSPGETVFQSDVQHRMYISVQVHEAVRKRSTGQDWVHAGPMICEFVFSMAQFASFVTSGGTEGIPCTIEFTGSGDHEPGHRPGLLPATRFQVTHDEVRAAASKAFNAIEEAEAAYTQAVEGRAPMKEQRRLLSELHSAIKNATPNVTYAAKTLDEHIGNVVEHARTDLETMVIQMAERRGVPVADVQAIGLGAGDEQG